MCVYEYHAYTPFAYLLIFSAYLSTNPESDFPFAEDTPEGVSSIFQQNEQFFEFKLFREFRSFFVHFAKKFF